MKNFTLLLLCVSLSIVAYSQAYTVGCGEYQAFFIRNSDKSLWGVGASSATLGIGSNPGTLGTPIRVALPAGTQVKSVSSALHSAIAIDVNGNVWFWGLNDGGERADGTVGGAVSMTPVEITKDGSGNAFNNVNQVSCWWNITNSEGVLACKNDGTVWVWGNAIGGMSGNGTAGAEITKPVQVNIPGNPHIVKVLAGSICMALDNQGNVYTWGGSNQTVLLGTNAANYTVPQKVSLPKPAKDIAGSNNFSYALSTDGTVYGWGIWGAYLGIGTGTYLAANTFQPLPVNLTNDLALPHPVSAISCNSVCTHVILTDSTLWGWGDNSQGSVGNGQELNFATYNPIYAWDWGAAELLQNKPVQLVPQVHNFSNIFGGSSACFYVYAETSTGQLYSCGRNKSAVLGSGVEGATDDLNASYPDGWEQPTMTAVNPFGLTKMYLSTCPYCLLNPGSYPCSEYKLPSNQAPVSVAGGAQTIALPASTGILNGAGSHDPDGIVVYYRWRQVSGPSTNVILDSAYESTRLAGLVAGKYVFSLTVTDNGWATNTSTVTVTVGGTGTAPTVSAGGGQTITLPTTSVTLTGTAAGNGGATIKSVVWTEVSGPVTAAIASPSSLTTAVSGLSTAGSYVFKLTATDNNGLTASGSVTVTVNPSVSSPPAVSASLSVVGVQSITLPVSTATLSGTATAATGTSITALSWKQASGPASVDVSSPSSSTTAISRLTVAGSYVFTLTATYSNGSSKSGSTTVTVNPSVSSPPAVSASLSVVGVQSITLPVSTATLSGTATAATGTSITALSWKQASGPASVDVSSPSSSTTAISRLTVAGSYVFTLSATYSNGSSKSGSTTVTVNPSSTPIAPYVTAGANQTIILPTTMTNLAGTAWGNGGATITSYFWELISGPSWVKFSNEWGLSTEVSELAAGTYVFDLLVTDNHGLTSTSTVTVVVKEFSAETDSPVVRSDNFTIDSASAPAGLRVYPNPVHDLMNVRIDNNFSGKVLIMIYDEKGALVHASQLSKEGWELNSAIDVSRLGQGVYFLKVTIGTGITTTSKFIKL